jgi:hypothetical protein
MDLPFLENDLLLMSVCGMIRMSISASKSSSMGTFSLGSSGTSLYEMDLPFLENDLLLMSVWGVIRMSISACKSSSMGTFSLGDLSSLSGSSSAAVAIVFDASVFVEASQTIAGTIFISEAFSFSFKSPLEIPFFPVMGGEDLSSNLTISDILTDFGRLHEKSGLLRSFERALSLLVVVSVLSNFLGFRWWCVLGLTLEGCVR